MSELLLGRASMRASRTKWLGVRGTVAVLGLIGTTFISSSFAQAPPFLGTLDDFAVLGGSTVTNTGPTVISGTATNPGHVGVSPGGAIVGFPPGDRDCAWNIPRSRRGGGPSSDRSHHRLQQSIGSSERDESDRPGPRRNDAGAGRLQLQQLGSIDGGSQAQRLGQPQCRLHHQHRQHADHRQQFKRPAH